MNKRLRAASQPAPPACSPCRKGSDYCHHTQALFLSLILSHTHPQVLSHSLSHTRTQALSQSYRVYLGVDAQILLGFTSPPSYLDVSIAVSD